MSEPFDRSLFSSSTPLVHQLNQQQKQANVFRRSLVPSLNMNRAISHQQRGSSIGVHESISARLVEEVGSETNSDTSESSLSSQQNSKSNSSYNFNLNHPSQHKKSVDLTSQQPNFSASLSSALHNNENEFYEAQLHQKEKQEMEQLGLRNRAYLKMAEWNELTSSLILQNMVPGFIADLTQDLTFWVEHEIEECMASFDERFQKAEALLASKDREIAKLSSNLESVKTVNKGLQAEIFSSAEDFKKQVENIDMRANLAIDTRSKYWIQTINELTQLFQESKRFIATISEHIPREVYMGELFQFKRLFANLELDERTIFSSGERTVQELYHELQTNTSSLFVEKDALNEQISVLQKKLARSNAMILQLQADQEKAVETADKIMIEKEQFDHQIQTLNAKIERQAYLHQRKETEQAEKRNAQMEAMHRKYIMTVNQQDASMKVNVVKCQNLDALAIRLSAENTAFTRNILEHQQEIASLKASIERTLHCYKDSLKTASILKEIEIFALKDQLEMAKKVHENNVFTLTEYYKSQIQNWDRSVGEVVDLGETMSESSGQQRQVNSDEQLLRQRVKELEDKVAELTLANVELQVKWEECEKQPYYTMEVLEKALMNTVKNMDIMIHQKEENDSKLQKENDRFDNIQMQLKEYERAMDHEIKRRRRLEKDMNEQRTLHEQRITMIQNKAMRDVARIRREADQKAALKGVFERNRKKSFREIRESGQLKDVGISEEIDSVLRKAMAQREADVIADRLIAESKVKDFYESAFKELAEHFEREQMKQETRQREFYESLLAQAKQHHAMLETSLVEDNSLTNHVALKETLKRTDGLEREVLGEKEQALSLRIELKKRDLRVAEIEAELEQAKAGQNSLHEKIIEQNAAMESEKHRFEGEIKEWMRKLADEETRGHERLKREKNLTMELHLMQTELQAKQIMEQNEKEWRDKFRLEVKNECDAKIECMKLEHSVEMQRLQKEFSSFKVTQTIKMATLKTKYDKLVKINSEKPEDQQFQSNMAMAFAKHPSQVSVQNNSQLRSSNESVIFNERRLRSKSSLNGGNERRDQRSLESWNSHSQSHHLNRSIEDKNRKSSQFNKSSSMNQTSYNLDRFTAAAQQQYKVPYPPILDSSASHLQVDKSTLSSDYYLNTTTSERDSSSFINPSYRRKLLVKDRVDSGNNLNNSANAPKQLADQLNTSNDNPDIDEINIKAKQLDDSLQPIITRSRTQTNNTKQKIQPSHALNQNSNSSVSAVNENFLNPALLDHYHNKSKMSKEIYRARKYDIFSIKQQLSHSAVPALPPADLSPFQSNRATTEISLLPKIYPQI